MFKEQKLSGNNGNSAAVKVKDWMLLDCLALLNLIPIVGTIVYLVIILIIGFGSKTAVSVKSRIKAALIWAAIWLVVAFILSYFFGESLLQMVTAMVAA